MTDLDEWNRHIRAELAAVDKRVRATRTAIAKIRASATSPGNELTVTTDASGHIQNIDLTPSAMRLGERRLAQLLIETIQRAETAAAKQLDQATLPLGTDPRTTRALQAGRELIKAVPTQSGHDKDAETATERYFKNRKTWLQ